MKRDRWVVRSAIMGILLLLVIAACSDDPADPSNNIDVVFLSDTIDIGRVQVGRDTSFTIPISFSKTPSTDSLRFLVTDPHFRVEPEVWESPEPLPDELTIRIFTTVADSYSTQIQVVASNELIGKITIAAVAWSPWASLHVTPGLIDFGRVIPGIESQRGVKIENSPLASTPCTLSVSQPIQDLEPIPGEIVLPPGQSEEILLRLTCGTEGYRRGDLEILSNDPFQSLIRVEVKAYCRGIPQLVGWPDTLDFNSTAVHVGKPRTLTLYNQGNGRLELEAITVPEEMVLSQITATIEIGDSLRLDVRWIPGEPGLLASVMEWQTNEDYPDYTKRSTVLTGGAVHGILPAEGLGGMTLDMTPIDLQREFGIHDYETNEPFCKIGWHFDSIQNLVFFPAIRPGCYVTDLEAEAIEIVGKESFTGLTEAGTGIGSTFQDVQWEFGLPDTTVIQGPLRWVAYPPHGIIFRLEGNRVNAIDVFRPEDWKKRAFYGFTGGFTE